MPRPNNNERLVMVSGGAGGVGHCVTQLFSAAGATVGIMDTQVEAENRLLAQAVTDNRPLRFYTTDVLIRSRSAMQFLNLQTSSAA